MAEWCFTSASIRRRRNSLRIGRYILAPALRPRGTIVKGSELVGRLILVVEDEPLIALDLKAVLEGAGANVICVKTRDAAQAAERPELSAAVLDARPASSGHRPIARRLKLRGIPFLFYATHPPEDVTTVRGAPIVLKPEWPDEIVAAVARLLRSAQASPGERAC
jgi:DNA-binding response OmpR family regulator